MKIEKCQKPVLKSKIIAYKRRQNNSCYKSDSSLTKRTLEGEIGTKNDKCIENKNIKNNPNHFGDADTYFRKTLRIYGNFDLWRKCHLDLNNCTTLKYPTANKKDKMKHSAKKNKQTKEIKTTLEPEQIIEENNEETETTTREDDEYLNKVDEILLQATRELEQVTEENQHLLKLLEEPPERLPDQKENIADLDNNVMRKLEEAEQEAKDAASKIYELKTRVRELLEKEELTEYETRELAIKNKELKEQMKLFEERTKTIQYLIEKSNIIGNTRDVKYEPIAPSKFASCDTKRGKETLPEIVPYNSSRTTGEGDRTGCCPKCFESLRKIPSMPEFAKKLSQSYSMQEKLATENADLEGVRFKLQEELLNKDQTLECLQRELGNLQNEMRIVARENVTLNERLVKTQHQKESKEKLKKQQKHAFKTSKKLQEYSDNTYELEKQLIEMENDVKYLHEEISAVQREREHLEKHRKMMAIPKMCQAPHAVPALNVRNYTSPSSSSNNGMPEHLIKELLDQYDKLENDLKFKINGVLTLKDDYENLKKNLKETEDYKESTQEKVEEYEKIMGKSITENELPAEQEQKILTAKKRLKKAQDTLKEEQQIINDQKKLVEDIAAKFMTAQQKIEEQRRNLEVKSEIPVDCSVNLGAQIVKNLHDKLEEIII